MDPVSGKVYFEEILYPERLELHTVPGIIRINFDAESTEDTGRYILDVEFGDDQLPMDDLVNVIVYNRKLTIFTF